jgi:hypothetical protein
VKRVDRCLRLALSLFLALAPGCAELPAAETTPKLARHKELAVTAPELRHFLDYLTTLRGRLEQIGRSLAADPPSTEAALYEARRRARADLASLEQSVIQEGALDRELLASASRLVERYVALRTERQLRAPEPCDEQESSECEGRRRRELEDWAAPPRSLTADPAVVDLLAEAGPRIERELRAVVVARERIAQILSRFVPFRPDSTAPIQAQRDDLRDYLSRVYARCPLSSVKSSDEAIVVSLDDCEIRPAKVSGVLEFRLVQGTNGETLWQIDATRYAAGAVVHDGRLLRAPFGAGGIEGAQWRLEPDCMLRRKTTAQATATLTLGECSTRDHAGGSLTTCTRPLGALPSRARPRDHVPNPIGDLLMGLGDMLVAMPKLAALSLFAAMEAPTTLQLTDPEFAAFSAICAAIPE